MERRGIITNEEAQTDVLPHSCDARTGRVHKASRNRLVPKGATTDGTSLEPSCGAGRNDG